MSDHDESGDEPRTSAPDATREAESKERDDTGEPPGEKPPRSSKSKAPHSPKQSHGSSGKNEQRKRVVPATSNVTRPRAALIAVATLVAGLAGGWFGHAAQAQAKLRAESAAPAGSGAASGPCGAWEREICASSGAESATCQEAKGAASLLTPSTCEVALTAMPATLARVKAARVPCDNLVKKLCTDLPPGSQTCQMVKERTGSFPSNRCTQMLEQYERVLAEVKMIDQQQGAMPMGAPGQPGHMPPAASPGPQGSHP